MKPIEFRCQAVLPASPAEICDQILNLENWSGFAGCWPIPGIRSAVYELRTPESVGSRIRVTNLDGSSHVEEIRQWQPERCIRLSMQEFSPPLSRLATHFDELWELQAIGGGTRVQRVFCLHPKSKAAWWPLKLIAFFLKRAVKGHLKQMQK